jgi:hypothetical protein
MGALDVLCQLAHIFVGQELGVVGGVVSSAGLDVANEGKSAGGAELSHQRGEAGLPDLCGSHVPRLHA